METAVLIERLRHSVQEIPNLQDIREGFHNPHVKAWKTKLEDTLREGGSTCAKALSDMRRLKNTLGGNEFIRSQTFINQLEALSRTIKQTIQTIEIFGRPEDKEALPQWGKPKSQELGHGYFLVGGERVATDEVTIHEVLDCLVSLAEDSDDLADKMRSSLIGHLRIILDDELLQPFLHHKIDKLLGHWPEFKSTAE